MQPLVICQYHCLNLQVPQDATKAQQGQPLRIAIAVSRLQSSSPQVANPGSNISSIISSNQWHTQTLTGTFIFSHLCILSLSSFASGQLPSARFISFAVLVGLEIFLASSCLLQLWHPCHHLVRQMHYLLQSIDLQPHFSNAASIIWDLNTCNFTTAGEQWCWNGCSARYLIICCACNTTQRYLQHIAPNLSQCVRLLQTPKCYKSLQKSFSCKTQ